MVIIIKPHPVAMIQSPSGVYIIPQLKLVLLINSFKVAYIEIRGGIGSFNRGTSTQIKMSIASYTTVGNSDLN